MANDLSLIPSSHSANVPFLYAMAKKPANSARTRNSSAAKDKGASRTSTAGRTRSTAASEKAAAARHKQSLRAIALYERALEKLQRRLPTAEALFQRVLDEFPDEHELHERCRRYLEVCARVRTPAPTPETFEERVYAATLALNAGAEDEALRHLEAAVIEQPDSDQVQYMLAVARATAGQDATAVAHLHRAIELNPDNKFLARHESSFQTLNENTAFQQALGSPPSND